jgi:hypothetical protein
VNSYLLLVRLGSEIKYVSVPTFKMDLYDVIKHGFMYIVKLYEAVRVFDAKV